jgi:threonine aldolase
MVIDLRSDTVTKPTAAMRRAMAEAEVGDDVYGEDPTGNAFEAAVAQALGHEAGLFCPSGISANQIGLRQLAGPGEEILAEWSAHILRAEAGALAGLSGVTTRTWRGERGLVDLDQIASLIAPRYSPYLVATTAIAVENTHNFGGGTIQPLHRLEALRALADEHGLLLHLDGARLWNAHVATGVPLDGYGRLFDTVSVCFSKGLGAPVGSVLVSTAERIERARVARRMTGGAMRQVGILAAGAHYAWQHHLSDLATDHERAGELAGRIGRVAPRVVDPTVVETNIVVLDLLGSQWDAPALAAAAQQRGVLVSVLTPRIGRLVTHRDLDAAAVEEAGDVLVDLLGS